MRQRQEETEEEYEEEGQGAGSGEEKEIVQASTEIFNSSQTSGVKCGWGETIEDIAVLNNIKDSRSSASASS